METLKNRFLAAFYTDNEAALSSEYRAILDTARDQPLSETDEKHLRQIQTAYKCLSPSLSGTINDLPQIHDRIQIRLRNMVRVKTPSYHEYSTWDNRLNLEPWQKDQVFKQAVTLQLTTGCSNYCRRCNEWALPRVRAHFTYGAAVKMIKALKHHDNTDLALYGGSDPLDWEDGKSTLVSLLENLDFPSRFSLLTKIPKGRESLVRQMADSGIPLSVSLTNRNKARIEALEQQMGKSLTKQHATPDLLIPACLDEDFISVKPSITDSYGTEISVDGANIIIPTFTSALYPFGHKKIPVDRDTAFFPVKKLGRPALLVDYFKPLEVSDKTGIPCHLSALLDVQVENILLDNGSYDLTPPGMRSVKEYFEVFDEKARHQRKKMTLSVMKRLKKAHLKNRPYAALSKHEKQRFRDDIQAHIDFSKKAPVMAARVSAASFFL
ncbi:MAG: radical SAM protein, partial [Desulfobacterales bacterium]|nr:radical SAM protein [Desulfobacterales bacterium]